MRLLALLARAAVIAPVAFVAAGPLASPAIAQDQTPPPPADKPPLHHFDDSLPPPGEGGHARRPAGQLFVSPAGEPFRAPFGEPYPVATWFAQADANHDGKLDRGEFITDFLRFFATLDLDHNDILEGDEINRYERDVLPELRGGSGYDLGGPAGGDGPPAGARRGGGGHHRGGGFGGQRLGLLGGGGGGGGGQDGPSAPTLQVGSFAEPISGAGRFSLINIPEPITSMDADLDGTISITEMRRAGGRRFDLLDPDGRGYLLIGDLPKTPVQRGGEGLRRRPGR